MKKVIISYPDTLIGFAAAFAAWYGVVIALPPDQERPEAVFEKRPKDDGLSVKHLDEEGKLLTLDVGYASPVSAWKKYVDGFPCPDVLRYAEDVKNELPESKEIRAFIVTLSRSSDSDSLMEWLEFDRAGAAFAGRAILRFCDLSVHQAAPFLGADL